LSKLAASRGWVRAFCIVPVLAIIAIASLVLSPARHPIAANRGARSAAGTVTPAARARLQASFAALPLAFEQNQGQTDPQVKYMARANGYTLFLTNQDAVFAFHPKSSSSELTGRRLSSLRANRVTRPQARPDAVVRMQLVGGKSAVQVAAVDPLPGKTNYYLGNDPQKWHTNVPQYARVGYKDVYPGIDLAYYGEQSKLEFDFIVAPNSNPAPIDLAFHGAQHLITDASGNLVVSSAAGDVVFHKPVAYQQQNGSRQPVDASFVLKANNQVSFALGIYDRSRELVIDPSVTYATYLGGTAEDDGYGIAFDSSGNAYVTGQTASTNFPVAGGVAPNTNAGGFDVFVTKLGSSGSSLIYSTYVGGSGNDSGNALAVNAAGDVFVAGGTSSSDFPTTAAAFQKDLAGSLNTFVVELNSGGTALTYSTYLGGTGSDVAGGIAIDATGAYIVGSTTSTDFPTLNPFQSSLAGSSNGFVTKLNTTGSALLYSTYLGGGTGDVASAVAVSSGAAYVTGATQNVSFPVTSGAFQKTCGSCSGGLDDAFVTVFDTAGTGLIYSTFLGGAGIDEGLGIAVDAAGGAYVTGMTQSTDFPVQLAWQKTLGGTQNAFLSQLNPAGSALVYSTYFGGSQTDWGTSVALDQNLNAYLTGQTSSTNFPVVNPTQSTIGGGNDAFVSELNSAGVPVFSTYLGGSLNENTSTSGDSALGAIAVDSAGANVYVTGNTLSTDFPTHAAEQTSEGGGIDAFIVKYAFPTVPDFNISATTPATVAPGSSGMSTVTLTSLNGYSSSVNLTCSVSGTGSYLPACSASSFSTNPQTPSAAGATSTLTVTTSGASAAMLRPSKFLYAMWLPIAGMSLAGMGFSSARSRRKKLLGFLMIGMVMAALFLMPACGGSSYGGGGGGGGCTTCTPAGNYTVTITGTGTDPATTTHSTTVTLTVN
jgi:hypothetical protein